MKKEELLNLKKECCHKTIFAWTCGIAPNGKMLKCRSCALFEKYGVIK